MEGIQQIALIIAFIFLLLALVLAVIRLIRGPEPANMIVALDLIASIVMAYILIYTLFVNKAIYFDVAIIISLISFMGTVAISNYLKQKS
jgi:multicomponent Na+:H+ antiporter subunit F